MHRAGWSRIQTGFGRLPPSVTSENVAVSIRIERVTVTVTVTGYQVQRDHLILILGFGLPCIQYREHAEKKLLAGQAMISRQGLFYSNH